MGRTHFPRAGEGGEEPLTAGVQLGGQTVPCFLNALLNSWEEFAPGIGAVVNGSGNRRGQCTVQWKETWYS